MRSLNKSKSLWNNSFIILETREEYGCFIYRPIECFCFMKCWNCWRFPKRLF